MVNDTLIMKLTLLGPAVTTVDSYSVHERVQAQSQNILSIVVEFKRQNLAHSLSKYLDHTVHFELSVGGWQLTITQ